MPALSIIVPIFNVENYLNKCIDSIIAQTFTDFELILVNDGSTDHCGDICDEYAVKDRRVTVIHKENEGQASARNRALEIIKGDYIGFVDGDDYIEKDMFEMLYTSAVEYGADVVECSINIINGKDIMPLQNHGEIEIGNNEFALQQLLDYGYRNSMCNKIYKREIFNNLRFPNKLYEDGFLAFKIYYRLTKYVFIGKSKYNYLKRNGSTMSNQEKFSLKNLDGLESQEERYYFLKTRISNQALLALTEDHFFKGILTAYKMLLKNKDLDPDKKYRNLLKNKIIDNYEGFLLNPRIKKYHLLIKSTSVDINMFNVLFINYIKGLEILFKIAELYRRGNKKLKAIILFNKSV